MRAVEVNFDGLIGPSHNYGGLSDGNLASQANSGDIARPREAALQGLSKMRRLMELGLVQGALPPLRRPSLSFLRASGFGGTLSEQVEAAAAEAPRLLKTAYSASSMWAANAATVTPSIDAQDERLHLSPANLVSMLHRAIEAEETHELLRLVFLTDRFSVHPPLPGHAHLADEGAANHTRLCAEQGKPGVHLFVYGREGDRDADAFGLRFPARQTLAASRAVARRHRLPPDACVFARQSPAAINAGAFHNDVVCVGSTDTLFFHEHAFDDTDRVLSEIETAAKDLFSLQAVCVPNAEVPLGDAVQSYLFNSQLVQLPGDSRLTLIAPAEAREIESTLRYCDALKESGGPIGRVEFVDVRQSMRNGGGPACLRLRVVMTEAELAECHPGVILDETRLSALEAAVAETYPESCAPADLADPAHAARCLEAREAVLDVLGLYGL